MSRIVLAMSGGVDSSVAAQLLVAAGHEVVGVFMRHGNDSPLAHCSLPSTAQTSDHPLSDTGRTDTCSDSRTAPKTCVQADNRDTHGGPGLPDQDAGPIDTGVRNNTSVSGTPDRLASIALPVVSQPRLDHKQGCCSAEDAEDARHVAERLGIPFYALNLQQEFDRIITYFVDEYTRGRTPNPCVMCNHWVKFGKLFAYADSLGAEYVATGHYARLVAHPDPSRSHSSPRLLRGVDTTKDQSYVLFGIRRALLSRMLLPLGGYRKSEIRQRASELGLRIAEKKDSQEICFVAAGQHADFVAQRRGDRRTAGDIVDTAGKVVGQHQGIERFTIGQRKGLNVAFGQPRFVVRIEPDTCRVVIGERHELDCPGLTAGKANWLVDPPSDTFSCAVQIRYNSPPVPARVRLLDAQRFSVTFDQPCAAVAPGQAAVCYQGDDLLGGGWIE